MKLKRLFEFCATIFLLSFIWPLMLTVAILVRLKIGPPILFSQTRPGLHGRPFLLYKFRTMKEALDAERTSLSDADRLTQFGKILRATSLDELPELWNVIKGDMGIVGPRPLLMQYLDRYTPEQARRHEVKPGLTGWAQVNGRNAITWEEKFTLDVWYVDNWTLGLDLMIIGMTIKKVLKMEGISQEGEATMPEFNPQITQIDAD